MSEYSLYVKERVTKVTRDCDSRVYFVICQLLKGTQIMYLTTTSIFPRLKWQKMGKFKNLSSWHRDSKLLSIIFAEDMKLSVCRRVAQNYCQYGMSNHISI
ncbi:hypothetical protein EMCRGX_G021283 [Ephydatia muelleri]